MGKSTCDVFRVEQNTNDKKKLRLSIFHKCRDIHFVLCDLLTQVSLSGHNIMATAQKKRRISYEEYFLLQQAITRMVLVRIE